MQTNKNGSICSAVTIAAIAAIVLGTSLAGGTAISAEEQAASLAPISAQPKQTQATFGDWIAHCQRIGDSAKNVCEAAQSLVVKGQSAPIAQIALSQVEKPAMVTVLAFRRCVPGGCLADAKLEPAALAAMRGATQPGKLFFTDAVERTLTLPLSFRGLAQAIDSLTKPTAAR